MMHTLLYDHKKEIRDLKKRIKVVEAATKKAEADQVAEVESLKTQLWVLENRMMATQEHVRTIEQRRASAEKHQATYKDVWKIMHKESISLKRNAELVES